MSRNQLDMMHAAISIHDSYARAPRHPSGTNHTLGTRLGSRLSTQSSRSPRLEISAARDPFEAEWVWGSGRRHGNSRYGRVCTSKLTLTFRLTFLTIIDALVLKHSLNQTFARKALLCRLRPLDEAAEILSSRRMRKTVLNF
jgi:hypothetical protein